MAVKTEPTTGGYDCQFVEDPPDDLKCSICLCVARDPHQHGNGGCGKVFCKNCITSYLKKRSTIQHPLCPYCCRRIGVFKDERSERDIQSLKVRCENSKEGCEWIDELRSLSNHSKSCGYNRVDCPNKCKRSVITEDNIYKFLPTKVLQKDVDKHLREECPYRQHTCPYCKKSGQYEEITGRHKQLCPKINIKCRNAPRCTESFLRECQDSHIAVCPYQRLPCKYKDFGCEEEPFRKDLSEHESNKALHLQITMDMVLSMQKKVQKLSKECIELRTRFEFRDLYRDSKLPVAPHRFKLTGYKKLAQKSYRFNSPPFLTHLNGYQVIICVDVKRRDGCVSVGGYLTKGKFDKQYEFPFKGIITVELLNQLEDDNHHRESVIIDRRGSRGKDGIVGINYGLFYCEKYILCKNLGLDTSKNCQYLKDDCLVFRVYVEVPSYKPWLQCIA